MIFASKLVETAIRFGYRRALARTPAKSKYRTRHSARRINSLIPFSGSGERYLEIGVERGITFEAIQAQTKVCVDPKPLFRKKKLPKGARVIVATSEQYFASRSDSDVFDLVFLDGLHTAEATYMDLIGAAASLSPGGIILIDDVMPTDEASALPSWEDSKLEKKRKGIAHTRWYGDVWKVAWLICERYPEIELTMIGEGGDEHTQAIVRLPERECRLGSNQGDDLAFMASLSFNDVVTSQSLGALLEPESQALAKFTRNDFEGSKA